ncbi:MAG: HIT domain-containing protein, partial [Candidatus Aenigmatarchaeota archaeon]
YIVYEDDNFMAFLDIRPMNPGHTLIIPKKHFQWTWEVPNFGEYFEVARKVALAIMKSLNSKMVHFITAGLGVLHAHIHVIPRFENDGHAELPSFEKVKELKKEEMQEIAEKIKNHLKKEGSETKIEEEVQKDIERELTEEEAEWIRREIEKV